MTDYVRRIRDGMAQCNLTNLDWGFYAFQVPGNRIFPAAPKEPDENSTSEVSDEDSDTAMGAVEAPPSPHSNSIAASDPERHQLTLDLNNFMQGPRNLVKAYRANEDWYEELEHIGRVQGLPFRRFHEESDLCW